jgi:type IV pilus biogenesis protein CpaD/CtpE
MRTVLAIAAIAALAACGQTTTVEPPAEPAAVEPPAPAPVTLTEADARARAETSGYTNVTGLVQNADGSWSATGTMNGTATQITIADTGVTVATAPAPATP